ncbi:oligosaccharide flippase family protein [Streptomyces sp. NPDC005181]|uniref:oligosaccharide flippase family protein n=1 Tax=Streptomyces sp. NPDC005181 TaxID=3156869 RepID=UPI0033A2F6F2
MSVPTGAPAAPQEDQQTVGPPGRGQRRRRWRTRFGSGAQGLLWNYAGSLLAVFLQLGYTACTGRLVSPAAFGSYALATATIAVLGYVANGGVATCLLRAPVLTRPLVLLALRITATAGLCCFLVAQLGAHVAERFTGTEAGSAFLVPLVRLLAVQFLVGPMGLAATAALRRTGRAGACVRLELLGQVAGCVASLTLLTAGWNPYALAVAAPLASAVTLTGCLWHLARAGLQGGPTPALSELLGPSTFFAGHSMVQYICNSAPLWLTGALFGPAATGHFSRAALFTGLPLTMLAQGITRAVAPLLAEARGAARQRAEHDALCLASALGFIGFGALAAAGPAALGLLLGPGWGEAQRLVPVLAAGAAPALIASVGDAVNQVRHEPRALIRSQLAAAAALAATLLTAIALRNELLLAACAIAMPAAAHCVQLATWGGLQARLLLRAHAAHAALGVALYAIGPTVAQRPAAGLAAALLVLTGAVLLRNRLPGYVLAARYGLIRAPVRAHRQLPSPAQDRVYPQKTDTTPGSAPTTGEDFRDQPSARPSPQQ